MTVRRDYYVYTHADPTGAVFYVGKGCGKRAWSKDRQSVWLHYVKHHLDGNYEVRIVHDHLTEQEAERLEDVVARSYGSSLLNVFNQHRGFNLEAWEKHEALVSSSRAHAQAALQLEKTDVAGAIAEYLVALEEARAADLIDYEQGLYSRIRRELAVGDLNTVNRITLCFKRRNEIEKAQEIALDHLRHYPAASGARGWAAIAKRTALPPNHSFKPTPHRSFS